MKLIPEAKISQSGENATEHTESVWPRSYRISLPFLKYHSLMVLSSDPNYYDNSILPEAKISLSGESATVYTEPVWFCS